MEKYEIIQQLGEGAFAVVIKAKVLNTGEIVAIKKLKKKYHNWQECVDLREVKSLTTVKKHDNIIQLKEMIRVEETLHLVFEYMEKNLYELLMERKFKKFNENHIKCIMFQTLQGVTYMHKYGFFHRDLKPENLLINGDNVKIADFGLAREIRSLPPYTDYVSTRYYRAPECILKSTNYNSPIDIWALGCIMIEMYNHKPIFAGNSEKEVLFKICSVLGSPTNTTWPEGIQLSKKLDYKFPTNSSVALSQIIPDASKDALDIIGEMLKWDPNKRSTASVLLQHPYFTKYPVPNRISTPEYNTEVIGNKVKSYSNNKNSLLNEKNKKNPELLYLKQNEENEFSKLLDDTKGFNEFILKMKEQKFEEDMKFLGNRENMSPIANKNEDEFDFDIPTYYKDKSLYQNNSILNANVSNINNITVLGANSLGITNNFDMSNAQQNQETLYNFGKNKTFFDISTLNNINDTTKYNDTIGKNKKEGTETNLFREISVQEDIFSSSRRKNLENDLAENLNNQNIKNEGEKKSHIEKIENEINLTTNKTIGNDKKKVDFDNCNIYLKVNNESNNNYNSRKRSAYKFIEETLEKGNSSNNNITDNIKSNKDSINDKQYNPQKLNNNKQTGIGSINNKSSVNPEPKQEYQSRRRNPMNILNELDNLKVVDINLNTNFNNKKEIDNQIQFRRNNNANSNTSLHKDINIGDNNYGSKLAANNFSLSNQNSGTGNKDNTLGLGSRRHVNSSSEYNNNQKLVLNKDLSNRDKKY